MTFDLTSFGSQAFNAASEGATDLQYTFHVRSQMRSLALEFEVYLHCKET